MSLVPHCRGVSGGTLGGLGVVGSRCLGCAGLVLQVSGSLSVHCPLSLLFLLPLPNYSPIPSWVLALADSVSALVVKEAVEIAPPSAGFYSCLFVTPKVTGGWQPVIDLSRLNGWVDVSHFHMETTQTVLQFLRVGDWMVSLDLRMRTYRFQCIHLLVGTCSFAWESRSTSFVPSASVCRWLPKRSPASWLLSPR